MGNKGYFVNNHIRICHIWWNTLGIGLIVGICLMSFWGCDGESQQEEAIEYRLCEEENLPEELIRMIQERKEEPFRLSYTTREYMYIAVGYGAQPRGGCGVQVNSLTRGEENIYIDTKLVGTDGNELELRQVTYPYVVVKCRNYDLPVMYRK